MATIDHSLERIAANPLEADVRLGHVGKASPSACHPGLSVNSQLRRRCRR